MAHLAVLSATNNMLSRSNAKWKPGLNLRPPETEMFALLARILAIFSIAAASSFLVRMIPTKLCVTS
ncbi:unannotated protein [freshwater metagenome]|uniref:Unannotated protein n=1 Tax=freshwater metagenome TaxID=449393 RepID=A0A6J6PH34_9ZZZZ